MSLTRRPEILRREGEVSMHKTLSDVLSSTLKPLCPRDSHAMHYEAKGIHWKNDSGDTESMPSYHCGYTGCSVRYTPQQGYFTLVKTPEQPYFVEEPATNVLPLLPACEAEQATRRAPPRARLLCRHSKNHPSRVLVPRVVFGMRHQKTDQFP